MGTTNDSESKNPPAINNAVITPIVFWPSFAPCVSEKISKNQSVAFQIVR
jgi:hypothetical protein